MPAHWGLLGERIEVVLLVGTETIARGQRRLVVLVEVRKRLAGCAGWCSCRRLLDWRFGVELLEHVAQVDFRLGFRLFRYQACLQLARQVADLVLAAGPGAGSSGSRSQRRSCIRGIDSWRPRRMLRLSAKASRIRLSNPMLCRLIVIGCWNWVMSRLMRRCPAITS